MNRLLQQLMFSGSTLALVSAASFIAGPAAAQGNAPAAASADTAIEEVVVTGTSIRGVAPIGADLMTVGVQDIANMGVSSATEALADVPAIEFFGSAGRGTTSSTNAQPGVAIEIHQVGAMSSASTLTLIDGHRAVQSGITNYYVNPDQIPTNMLQRVEVLADGSSAVYGSDAVAGVVNFITRKSFDGLQLEAQSELSSGATNYMFSLLAGHSWEGGSFVFGASYNQYGQLKDTDRPYTSPLAQPARAAAAGVTGPSTSNFGNFLCTPATIQPTGLATIYTSPTSGVAVANTPNNQMCQQWSEASLFPSEQRQNAMMKVTQQFGSKLNLEADMLYYHRTNQQQVSAGTLQATAFGTGPQANPFYMKPVGYTGTATSETVRYDLNGLLPPGLSSGGDDTISLNVNAAYTVTDNWEVDFNLTAGRDDEFVDTRGVANGAAALLALNGTGSTGGSTTATDIPGYNNVTLNLPLTAANALDVWDPVATNKTSAATITQLENALGTSHGYFGMLDYKLSTNGSLFDLFGGGVTKVAVGFEVNNYSEKQIGTNAGSAAPRSVDSLFYDYDFGRGDTAEYVELDVPMISASMNIPLVQKLEMDFAVRHDHYSDFGGTTNPKASINWDVMDGLRLRANWSTSFVAPVLTLEGGAQGLANFSSVGASSGGGSIPVQYYPTVTQFGIPGCTASSVTCNISTLQGISNGLGGGPHMTPAIGRTLSFGTDYSPTWLPGLDTTLTFWNNDLTNVVATPQFAVAVTNTTLLNHLTLYPNCATQAQITAFTVSETGYQVPQTSAFPSCVQFTNLSVSNNYLYLWVNGLDYTVNYRWDMDNWGGLYVGANGTQLLRFSNAYSYQQKPNPAQIFSTLNTEGINTGYPALAITLRAHVGWDLGGAHAELFANYSGGYRNVSSTAATPLINNAANVYSGMGGDHVPANVTFDMHLGYDFDGGMFGDDSLALTVDNMLDKKPPFYNVSAGYDFQLGNPVGRTVTINFKSKL